MLSPWVPFSLQSLAHSLRHPVLDVAHPLPERLDLSLGRRGSLQQHLIVYTLAAVEGIDGRVQIVNRNSTQVTLADEHGSVHGAVAVCRYLGRLWKLYPVCPRNALSVDGFLELLVHPDEHDDRSFLVTLDTYLAVDAFLGGFASPTIADVCWHACICWLYGREWEGAELFPHLSRWFQSMQTYTSNITNVAGESTTSEDDDSPHADYHTHWE